MGIHNPITILSWSDEERQCSRTYTFSSNPVTPTTTLTLTINTATTTPLGTYTITITGTGENGSTAYTTIQLTVASLG